MTGRQHMPGSGDPDEELWREAMAVLRAKMAGDYEAFRFLLDSTANPTDLNEMLAGFAVELLLNMLSIMHPETGPEEAARFFETELTTALRQGPGDETDR